MIIVPENAEEFADVSFWQGIIDWDRYPHKRVILRIGQGGWQDTKFQRNYEEARKRNIAVGGYWFYDDRYSPLKQYEIFHMQTVGKKLELGVFMDWENSYNGAYKGLKNVVACMQRMDDDGFDVGFYTGYYWFTENSNPVDNASQYKYLATRKLWIASYNPPSNVQIPKPWTDWHIWQKETRTVDWGQETKEIDVNVIRVESEKEPMIQIAEVKPGYSIRYRDGASINGTNVLGTLFGGDKVVGTIVNGWFTIDHVVIAGVKTVPAVQAYMYYDPNWFLGLSEYVPPAGTLKVTHIFNDTMLYNGKKYHAEFRIDDVEYHEIA